MEQDIDLDMEEDVDFIKGYEAGKSRIKPIMLEILQHYEAHHKDSNELFTQGYCAALRDYLGEIGNEDLTTI